MRKFNAVFLLFTFFFTSFYAQASHVLGAELSYIQTPNVSNHIKIILKLYRDPSGISLGSSQGIASYDGTYTNYFTCGLDSVEVVKFGCSDSVEVYHYSSSPINLSGYNEFSWNACCRAPGIQNIAQVGAGTAVKAEMITGINYLAPLFYGPQILSVPSDSIVNIDLSSFSPSGDSLYTELVQIQEYTSGSFNPVTLDSSYTYLFPFDTTHATTLNHSTGILSVVNPAIGNYAIGVKVSAYDTSGVLRSTITRDVSIFIKPNNGHVLQPEGELRNAKATTLKQYLLNGEKAFSFFANDTLEFEYWIRPKSNAQAIPVLAKANLRGLWADASQGGLCYTNDCASLYAANNLLVANDSLLVKFKFSPSLSILNGQDSITQIFKMEFAVVDSCGFGITETERIHVTVKKPTISSTMYSMRFCERDSMACKIIGDNANLSWHPSTGVNNHVDSTYYLSPVLNTVYRVYNLNDSSFIVIDVEIDSLLIELPLSVVNDTMVVPPYYQQFTSWSYVNGVHTFINPDFTPIDVHGKYWIKMKTYADCDSYSDTLYNTDPNIAVSSARCNGNVSNTPNIARVSFNFRPVLNNTILKRFRIMFERFNLSFNTTWEYKLSEVGNATVLTSGDLLLTDNILSADSVWLNLENTKTYLLEFTPKVANMRDRWLQFEPPSFPFTDENNLIEFVAGKMLVPIYNDVLPFIEMEVKQPNIGLEESNVLEANVYPNPFEDLVEIEVNGQGKYLLLDALGSEVLTGAFEGNFSIETETLSRGLYVLQLNAMGKTTSLKLMK